jgi:hypothetical protein
MRIGAVEGNEVPMYGTRKRREMTPKFSTEGQGSFEGRFARTQWPATGGHWHPRPRRPSRPVAWWGRSPIAACSTVHSACLTEWQRSARARATQRGDHSLSGRRNFQELEWLPFNGCDGGAESRRPRRQYASPLVARSLAVREMHVLRSHSTLECSATAVNNDEAGIRSAAMSKRLRPHIASVIYVPLQDHVATQPRSSALA